jgi:hypothetical protein
MIESRLHLTSRLSSQPRRLSSSTVRAATHLATRDSAHQIQLMKSPAKLVELIARPRIVRIDLYRPLVFSPRRIALAEHRFDIIQLDVAAGIVLPQVRSQQELGFSGHQIISVDRRYAGLLVVSGLQRIQDSGHNMTAIEVTAICNRRQRRTRQHYSAEKGRKHHHPPSRDLPGPW